MRRLGPDPLTGAQKQRRHRERVKARLAEAEILRARQLGAPETLPGLSEFYDAILAGLGAKPEERVALAERVDAFRAQLQVFACDRAARDLDALRVKRRKVGASLLSRLAAIKAETGKD